MQSAWRVACVRIPRFPIGAVWRQANESRADARAVVDADAEQLELGEEMSDQGSAVSDQRDGAGLASSGSSEAVSLIAERSSLIAPAPHWDSLPLALLDGPRLCAVTAAAARQGVRAGMTPTEAHGRCVALELLAWDEPAVAREVVRATAALLVASAQVTPVAGAPGLWWVGAGGVDGPVGERGLVRTLRRVARLWHPRARVAVADSCVAARAATWADHEGSAVYVVPRGGCAAYLAPAPLALLPMEDALRRALVASGLRTAGALAALAPAEVERRWGTEGVQAWRLARGDDRRRPVPAHADTGRTVSVELAIPAATLEPVLVLVRAALERLVARLVADGRAAVTVAITLTLDDGRGALPAGSVPHTVTRELRLPCPLARVAPLLERCRALLDRWPLSAPVGGVKVAVVATAPTVPTAAGRGGPPAATGRDAAAAGAALAQLRAELGPNVWWSVR